ncbi:DUF5931 domain-containing protein [Nocardioides sp. 616]|uniref:MacS family sensor histidine kinase n=1 Tax=Nocardioides sp. 616 TaxID=2268090 RepID=UPI001F05957B|nr:DUF5931 domain-containing protein [Nocardioides sp. 616]
MPRPRPGLRDPDAAAGAGVEDRLFDALAVLRVLVTINMVGLTVWRWDNFVRPTAALVAVALLVLWTGVALVAYRDAARRTLWLLGSDLAVAALALGITPWLKGDGFRATLPGFWVMGALLAWAVHWHWRGGLVAAVILSVVDVAIRQEVTQTNYGHVFLLLLGGTVVGYMAGSVREMAVQAARADRATAAAEERARLARAVHDGVLQVLSLVQRRGAEIGGEFGELSRLAAEQESRLRSLIRAQDTLTEAVPASQAETLQARRDLSAAVEALASSRVTVVTPGTPVPMPAPRVEALVGAVRACLDNVSLHVGLDAPAWVLLEHAGDEVTVSVRDEGPGIPPDRLEAAAREGRLGVASSIRGRLEELAGTASVHTGAQGTEWELTARLEEPR